MSVRTFIYEWLNLGSSPTGADPPNGRMDLTQAEAVADQIDASNSVSALVAGKKYAGGV